MAFGEHWEWRGFGGPPQGLRSAIESLPLLFPTSQDITDHYLWAPGSTVNVKLRLGDLKFKRLLETAGGLERWIEDEAENHPFPVAPDVLEKLAGALGISLGPLPASCPDRDALVRLLDAARPAVRRVSVSKTRWGRLWRGDTRGGEDEGRQVIVEIAEISSPERISSIAIEHPSRERVAAARDALGLPGGLRRLSYLDAISLWARGETIGG
jgi:hypothetical protein